MNDSSPIGLLVADASNASSVNSCLRSNPASARTALGILWSCLSVLFACTWVSVHPNVPGPNEGPARRLWTKMKLMIVALIAPELLVMWAVRQWYAARRLTKGYRKWTKTHAFFALMGGFALYEGRELVTVLRFIPSELKPKLQESWGPFENSETKQNILDDFETSFDTPASSDAPIRPSDAAEARAENYFDDRSFAAHASFIHRMRKDELEDRNKSDGFAKLIAVSQTTWFVVQLCARWAKNLPVTELEIMTLAFAAMNVPIYFFWWNKPLGVGVPIRIQRDAQTINEDPDNEAIFSPSGHTGLPTWAGIEDTCSLLFQQVIHKFEDKLHMDDSFKQKGLLGKMLHLLWEIYLLLLVEPALAIMYALVWEGLMNDKLLPGNVASFERTLDLEPKNAADKLITYGAAMIFGGIHCIAWTSQFPSDQEKILWRVCSLLVACIPIYMALINVYQVLYPAHYLRWYYCLMHLYVIAVPLYIFARLSLLVQGFLALRALPPAVLEAVPWTNYLPHI